MSEQDRDLNRFQETIDTPPTSQDTTLDEDEVDPPNQQIINQVLVNELNQRDIMVNDQDNPEHNNRGENENDAQNPNLTYSRENHRRSARIESQKSTNKPEN